MQRTSVRSSNIKSIGYNADSQTLEVEFHNGGIYQYSSVPQAVYNGLMSAASHGKYLYAYIKGKYAYKKIN